MMEDPDLHSPSGDSGLFGWFVLMIMALIVLIIALSPNKAPDKVTLELHVNGNKKVLAIDRDKIVSIDLYPESGAYKITYTADNIEETL